MTVSTEISSNEYTGNGVTTDFDYKFRIFKANQLSVITSDTDGDNVVTLRLGTDYTVTGANKSAGGKVILTKPLANGHKISIARDIPIKQETSFRNQSKFFAETHEDAFDYLTMILQRIWGSLGSLYLKRPNILANWFDAKGYRIANLGKPKRDSDAVDLGTLKDEIEGVNSTILKKEKRTLRVDDIDIPALPKVSERRNKQIGFDNLGMPTLLDPAETGALGYILVDSFENGALITSRYQALHFEYNGEYYRWDGDLPKLVPAESTPESTGGVGQGAWISVGDASLRSELSSENGVLSVSNATIYVSSLLSMITLPIERIKNGQQVITHEYKPLANKGGGRYFYSENIEKRYHDGGTIISPTVPFTSNQMNYLNGVGETDLYGKGCFVRYVDDFVNPEWFGAEPSSDVTYILNHVLLKHTKVEVTDNYLIDVEKSVSLVSKRELKLGISILSAKPTSKSRYDILRIVNADNVKVFGGFLIGDRDEHEGTTGEHGYGIFISGKSRGVFIQGTHASNFWGDGFYIGASDHKKLKNISMLNCTSDNNRRQGLSITSGEYIYIKNCEFSNTNGTTPQDGVCIEPNVQQDPTQKVRYVIVDGCYSHGNAGDGFAAIGRTLDRVTPENSGMLNCSIINCVAKGNAGDGIKANETFNLVVLANHVTESAKNGINLMVACDGSSVSGNRVISCGEHGILMNNGCWDNSVNGNYIAKCHTAISLYNSRGNNIYGNTVKECNKGVVATQSLRSIVTANSFSDIKYQAIVFSNASTRSNQAYGNTFHNVAFSEINETDGFYGAVVDFTGGASYNLVDRNLFTHDTGKAPKRSYFYVRNSSTVQNKMVHNNYQDPTIPRLYTESGPATPSNEVIEVSSLYKYPW
ncbi:right-handed parallel beta-helix repeat-containing protein [Providencia rettgeri]|uniref:right-handed parallel beta-helix repeat-containing protein n=1 Tax=Providencia rettgeri TaxID=587 RepID=UPI00244A680E|nr:right-handed parallel beta-helix repeat-containing protein [Providencia rettgeri]MDH2394326.1 right-handed parallel beta-helix repeat-containing protein [Providencia rettgeri]